MSKSLRFMMDVLLCWWLHSQSQQLRGYYLRINAMLVLDKGATNTVEKK